MQTIIAIDPGKSGGIAILDADGLTTHSMPDGPSDIVRFLRAAKKADAGVWIEEIPKFAGRNIPSSTTAVLFENYGLIVGAALALGYSLHRVPPKVWQEPLGLGGRKSCDTQAEWKRKLRNKAAELFPDQDVTLGNADALLILHYVRGGGR